MPTVHYGCAYSVDRFMNAVIMAKMTGKNLYDMADLYDVITMYIAGTKDQRNT